MTNLLGYTVVVKIGKEKKHKVIHVFNFFVYFEIRNLEVSHASLTLTNTMYMYNYVSVNRIYVLSVLGVKEMI